MTLEIIFVLTILAALTSQFMPNPAVAVLLAPISLRTASVLVMGPGGYRLSDYLKVGIPLTLVMLVVVLLIMPVFWLF